MIRSLMLFVHVVGVLAMFTGLGLEWLSLDAVRRSTLRAEAVRWVRVSAAVPRISAIALVVVVASGFYLGARVGVLGQGWMRASYAALLLMGMVAGPLTQPRIRALQRATNDPTRTSATPLQAAASHSILRVSLRLRVVFGLAVVYLMIGKPDAGGSVLVLSLASIVAIAVAVARRAAPSTLVETYQ
jgi:uncharacterized membrane protein